MPLAREYKVDRNGRPRAREYSTKLTAENELKKFVTQRSSSKQAKLNASE
jgi:hypothetical protein